MTGRDEHSLPLRTLGVAAAVVVAFAVPGAFDRLVWDREAIGQGSVWRIATGQLVHGGGAHLLWDILPLVLVGVMWENALGRRYWVALGLSLLAVGVGLFFLDPRLVAYCGLSGALVGLWVAGGLGGAASEERAGRLPLARLYRAAAWLGVAKIGFEVVSGSTLFVSPANVGGSAVPLAHALGALGGAVAVLRPRRAS